MASASFREDTIISFRRSFAAENDFDVDLACDPLPSYPGVVGCREVYCSIVSFVYLKKIVFFGVLFWALAAVAAMAPATLVRDRCKAAAFQAALPWRVY